MHVGLLQQCSQKSYDAVCDTNTAQREVVKAMVHLLSLLLLLFTHQGFSLLDCNSCKAAVVFKNKLWNWK